MSGNELLSPSNPINDWMKPEVLLWAKDRYQDEDIQKAIEILHHFCNDCLLYQECYDHRRLLAHSERHEGEECSNEEVSGVAKSEEHDPHIV